MRMRNLCNKHYEETAWIFGTGASLDAADFAEVEGVRICLNRAIGAVPHVDGQTYWLVADDAWGKEVPGPWDKWFHDLVFGNGVIGVFQDPLLGPKRTQTPVPDAENIVKYKIQWSGNPDPILDMDREIIALNETLYSFSGTAPTAAHLAWFMGCDRVVIVGCDGDGTIANRVRQWYDDGPIKANHKMSRDYLQHVIDTLDLEYENRSKRRKTDGEV